MKWSGKIGYAITSETSPGVWEPKIIEKPYIGDVINNRWDRQNSQSVNDEITISTSLSIIADTFMDTHCSEMAYAVIRNTKWRIKDINDLNYPRVILNLGGVYHG